VPWSLIAVILLAVVVLLAAAAAFVFWSLRHRRVAIARANETVRNRMQSTTDAEPRGGD
jgi:uncharacterized protein YpmS